MGVVQSDHLRAIIPIEGPYDVVPSPICTVLVLWFYHSMIYLS